MDKGIKKIIDFIEDVTKSSPKGNNGKQFEENVEIFLSQKDFIKINWKVEGYFNNYFNLKDAEIKKLKEKIKKDISAKYLSQPVKNPFKDFYKNEIYMYIYQPFGSQDFPDFLILTKNYVIPLEIKYSSKSGKKHKPKWNSNIPKPNAIYIYAVSSNQHKPICFLGSDYIGPNTFQLLNGYFESFDQEKELNELKSKMEKDNTTFNPFGLKPKIRTDYLNNNDFVFGNEDKLDIFDFSLKMKWKENVLKFLKELENEE